MITQFAFLDLGAPELIVILLIILLLFGSKKLPQLTRSIGSAKREFRKGMDGPGGEDKKDTDQP
jgi:sec-independent protein translocase protein TatA